jgi:hypothetical protein
MPNEIVMSEFDGINSGNKYPIHLIQYEITITAPIGARVEWQYPGYISIGLPNGTEIAFGESLESDSGYSWNSYDLEGVCHYCDTFGDLGDIKEIARKLWDQASPLLENKGE